MPIFIQYFCNISKRNDLWLILWKMKYLYTMKNKNISSTFILQMAQKDVPILIQYMPWSPNYDQEF